MLKTSKVKFEIMKQFLQTDKKRASRKNGNRGFYSINSSMMLTHEAHLKLYLHLPKAAFSRRLSASSKKGLSTNTSELEADPFLHNPELAADPSENRLNL